MARKVKVDFTGVEAFQRVSEGIHHAKISDIQEKTSQGGDSMLQVAFEVTSGEDKGNKVFDNLVLTDKALWKFKSLLQVLNMKCDGKVAVDLDKMIGKTLDINVTHEEYNGQIRARVSDYMKPSAASSDDEDDDAFDDDDIDETEEEEEPKPKKKPTSKKVTPKKKPEPEPEEDEDDDWDEDDEEEEEESPAPKKKAPAKKAPAKRTKKKPEPVEEDDDDEDDDDDWEED